MASYLIRRFLLMLLTLFGISVLIFVLLRMVPGNIADILFAAAGMIDPADKASLERELGLDQPILNQYIQWIVGLAHVRDIDSLPQPARLRAQQHAVSCGRTLITGPACHGIDELWLRATREDMHQ